MIKFGTDGWRGVIADDFTFDRLWQVACAIVRYVTKNPGGGDPCLLIGYDTRFHSDNFAKLSALAAYVHDLPVLISSGFVTSPSISFSTVDKGADGAIMITASHNPPKYNGIKFKAPYGGSASKEITESIESELREIEENPPERPAILFEDILSSGKVEQFDPIPAYIDKVVSVIDADTLKGSNLRIMFDPMYGAGQGLFGRALSRFGMECDQIHGVHNPLFPGLFPEPIGSHLDDLRRAVVEGEYQVGIAVDGDADRVTAIDATGRFISSHMVLALLLRHLKEVRGWSGDAVKTVSTTSMIDMLCDNYGMNLHVVPVGFKNICDLMLEKDILVGGEESGGTGMKNYIPERDGILVGLMLIEIMAKHNKTLGELIDETMDELGRRFEYIRRDIELTLPHKEALLEKLPTLRPDSIGGMRVTDVETIDGLKFYREDGSWLMLRVSGTESVVRIYAEAGSVDGVKELVAEGQELIDEIDHP